MVVRRDARSFSSSSSVKYSRLSQDDSGFIDAQFQPIKRKIPWKAISYAALLSIGGLALLIIGCLLVTGVIHEKYGDRTWPLIILGALMFIPGGYHTYLAYYAFMGYQGFSFDDIPSYDDDQ